ncbi:MAG: hypothetical protein ACPG4T_21410, partial [Nannocystaceae bacterium]
EGSDVMGHTCADEGFEGGTLTCNGETCQYNTGACFQCGDGIVNGPEACDGNNLENQTCQSQGFVGGTLTCQEDCSAFNTSACTTCGNDVIDGGELCDNSNLNGQTCLTQGFLAGALLCEPGCNGFNTTQCNHGDCCQTGNPGSCSDVGIRNCVCAIDAFCCDNTWDMLCVSEAINDCGAQCP